MLPTLNRRTVALAELAVPLIELAGPGDGPLLTVIAGSPDPLLVGAPATLREVDTEP